MDLDEARAKYIEQVRKQAEEAVKRIQLIPASDLDVGEICLQMGLKYPDLVLANSFQAFGERFEFSFLHDDGEFHDGGYLQLSRCVEQANIDQTRGLRSKRHHV